MPIPKKNKPHVKPNDGRKHNVGVTKDKRREPKLTPAKFNKAKKDRIPIHAINSIKHEFGSEENFFSWLAERSRKSNYHLGKLLDYAYGKPEDIDRAGKGVSEKPIAISFINNAPKQENTIDVSHEEDIADSGGGEGGN